MSFKFKTRRDAELPLAAVTTAVASVLNASSFNKAALGTGLSAGMESMAESDLAGLEVGMESFDGALKNQLKGIAGVSYTEEQRAAATVAGMLSANPMAWFNRKALSVGAESGDFVQDAGRSAPYSQEFLKAAQESFGNSEKARDLATASVVFNLNASRQDEFCDTVFRPYTLTPEQYGIAYSVRLYQLQDFQEHAVNGKIVPNWGRKNLLKAEIDPSILRNNSTQIKHIMRPENEDSFADPAVVVPVEETFLGEKITTSLLKPGVEVSLLPLSQTDTMLSRGLMNQTDELDTRVTVKSLAFQVNLGGKTDIIELKGFNQVPSAAFLFNPNGRAQRQVLSMDTTSIVFNSLTRNRQNLELEALKVLADNKLVVRARATSRGELDLEFGVTTVDTAKLIVTEIYYENDPATKLDLESTLCKDIVEALNKAVFLGYSVDARRTNTNFRTRDQLLDVSEKRFVYGSRRRGPVSVIAPNPAAGANNDLHADINGLIYHCTVRTKADAIQTLLQHEALLASRVGKNGDHYGQVSDAYGPAAELVTPFYEHFKADLTNVVTYSNDAERRVAIAAYLQNKLLEMSSRMIRDSGFKVAMNALNGTQDSKPTIVILTDIVTAQWLYTTGDFRTLGDALNVKLCITQNNQFYGKIRFFPAESDSVAATSPLAFGTFLWRPELVTDINLTRDGVQLRELTVMPDYEHIVNLPVMGSIDVTGLTELVESKSTLLVHPQ